MTFSFHPEAEKEFLAAIDFYEENSPGLGTDFAVEVYSTIQRIIAFPHSWSIIDGEVRRCLLRRFHFGVVYSVEENYVLIIAVMHLHRQPGYWKKRSQV